MPDSYRIIGAEMSPYSVKVRSYFRDKGLPHQRVCRIAPSPPESAKYAKMPIIPLGVTHEGPGIPEAKLEGIFERFYSERPSGERFGQHSGLGLSICRQIVEGLRGRIAAETRRDADGKVLGARFVIRLPVG